MSEFLIRWDPDPPGGDTLRSWGRNGMSKCAGVHLQELGHRVVMRPITSRGLQSSSASIELPHEPETLREIAGSLLAMAGRIEGKLPGVPAVPQTQTREPYVVCEVCGAVEHGNANCRECVSHWPGHGIKQETVDQILEAIGNRPPEPPVGADEAREFLARIEGAQP